MANGRQKVTTAQVQEFLTGNKATIKDVAEKFTVTAATARKHVLSLVGSNVAKKDGTRGTGARGRSPDLYTLGSTTTVATPAAPVSTTEVAPAQTAA